MVCPETIHTAVQVCWYGTYGLQVYDGDADGNILIRKAARTKPHGTFSQHKSVSVLRHVRVS